MADSSDPTLGELLGTYTDVSFGDPEPLVNRPASFIAITIVFMVLSWLCVSFRLYTRLILFRSAAGWDDVFVGLFLVTTTFFSISVALGMAGSLGPQNGLGQHLLNIRLSEFTGFLHTFYFMNATYLTSTAFIKLSLLFQFLRLFEKGSIFRHICIVLIVFTSLWGVAYSFIGWFPCFPVDAFWNNPLGASCYGYGDGFVNDYAFAATYESHSATNTFLDFAITLIPIPLLFERNLQTRARWGVATLLAVGGLVNVFSVWRLVSVIQHRAGMYPAQDPTWYAPITILLAALEVDMASICASVPIFWPVIEQQFGKIFITQEVKITSEERWQTTFTDNQSLTELTPHGEDLKSRKNSDLELGPPPPPPPKGHHRGPMVKETYADEFRLSRIDPFKLRQGSNHVQATIQSQGGEKRSKWWRL